MEHFDELMAEADQLILERLGGKFTLVDSGKVILGAIDRKVSGGAEGMDLYVYYEALVSAADIEGLSKGDRLKYNGKQYRVADIDREGSSALVEFY